VNDPTHNACFHIHVPAMQDDGSAVLLDLRYQSSDERGVEKSFEVWLPREVMASFAQVLPQIMNDMYRLAPQEGQAN